MSIYTHIKTFLYYLFVTIILFSPNQNQSKIAETLPNKRKAAGKNATRKLISENTRSLSMLNNFFYSIKFMSLIFNYL